MADPKKRFDTIVKKLRENNHKLTPQRLEIAKVLAHSTGHPNVEKIYEQLQDRFPTMSLATVYRNVMLLKSLGEVLELGFPDGSNRYDGNKPHPHPHVICIQCRKIIDPDLVSLKDMADEVADETGFKILTHRLDFFGICGDCLNKTA
jgi:Fur family transcriptional regulator, peroxide stress response regulator